jgi:lysophospholipase L1-like esterase
MRVTPRDYVANLAEIVNLGRKAGSDAMILCMPLNWEENIGPDYLKYHALSRETGQRLGVPVADIHEEWNQRRLPGLFQQGNPNHPSAAGNQRIAEKICGTMIDGLAKSLCGPIWDPENFGPPIGQ